MSLTVRFLVRGVVQGVGYRAFARRAALRLGLAGYARNLADGGVECVVRGDPLGVSEYEALLRRGPSFSRVDEVAATEISDEIDLPISFVTY